MDTAPDLKEIKRRVYLSYFQDGLWDILLGLFIVGWGLIFILEFTAVMGGFWIALYFLILGLKKWLTYPRTGYIKLAESRKQHMRMVILGTVTFLLGIASLLLFNGGNIPQWVDDYFMFMFGVMTGLVITMLGYWWRVTRWYVYAALIIISSAAYQWAGLSLGLSIIIPGGMIACYGLYKLALFLRRHPKSGPEETDAAF